MICLPFWLRRSSSSGSTVAAELGDTSVEGVLRDRSDAVDVPQVAGEFAGADPQFLGLGVDDDRPVVLGHEVAVEVAAGLAARELGRACNATRVL